MYNVFAFRDNLIKDYSTFSRSFTRIVKFHYYYVVHQDVKHTLEMYFIYILACWSVLHELMLIMLKKLLMVR